MDEEEKELVDTVPKSEEDLLMDQIALLTVRERRIMKAINKYKDEKAGVYINNVVKRESKRRFKDDKEKESYEREIEKKVREGKRLPGVF